MPRLAPRPAHGTIDPQPLFARSRRELFRHIRAVVLTAAPSWGDKATQTVVSTSPPLDCDDVQYLFDVICEKYRVDGVALRFELRTQGSVRAIFEPRPGAARQALDSACGA
jgi:hypothetical protein